MSQSSLSQTFQDIADAIRDRNGLPNLSMTPHDMAGAIRGISYHYWTTLCAWTVVTSTSPSSSTLTYTFFSDTHYLDFDVLKNSVYAIRSNTSAGAALYTIGPTTATSLTINSLNSFTLTFSGGATATYTRNPSKDLYIVH